MKLTSSAFKHGESMPEKYTCDGQNISPPLEISGTPSNTKSFVLIMDDPDIPDFVRQKFGIQVWDHWTVFNIPPETKDIPEGKNPQGVLGINTGKKVAYGGPCPPDKEHRYFFKLYALDIAALNLSEGATKADIEKATKGHILAEAVLIGKYQRKATRL